MATTTVDKSGAVLCELVGSSRAAMRRSLRYRSCWSLAVRVVVMVMCGSLAESFLNPLAKRGPTATRLPMATAVTNTANELPSTVQSDAQELLQLVVNRHWNGNKMDKDQAILISNLIDRLSAAEVTFDVSECLANGVLFVVLYQEGPKAPLWEKIGVATSKNLQGQLYTSTLEDGVIGVRNYAEILGQALYIQVEGTAVPKLQETDAKTISSATKEPSWWQAVSNLFSTRTDKNSRQQNRVPCPCDYVASVNGGGLYWQGRKVLDLSMIQGTGVQRTLYADPQLRIFEAPGESNGGWEAQGLRVVQVRRDLLHQ